ncbi:hypothetical protein [Streptomyces sp. 2112.3]|uniref:hypothetical protein n=1 Tax=Streptomyces sp. 2112.3 TaxID=1881023 RepID=UPI00115F91FA|nr:hypothetical protein [Streptomyces sp. 2112.3]
MNIPPLRWSFRQVPGWGEDERLRRFYESCFRGDTIHEIGEFKPYASDGSEFAHRLQVSLEYLLEQQPASTKDWLSLTGFQFFSEGELYGFLLDVYHYFYGDRAEPPSAPDPDRPPPGNQDQFWTEWR